MRGENEWSQHVAETAAETGLSGTNGLFEVAARSYRLRRSQSSIDEGDSGSEDESDSSSANSRGRSGTQLIRTRSIINRISGDGESSDEESATSTQLIRTRSGKRRTVNGNGNERGNGVGLGNGNGSGLAGVADGGSDMSDVRTRARSEYDDGEKNVVKEGPEGRGRGSVPARNPKGPASSAEDRLRSEVDSW